MILIEVDVMVVVVEQVVVSLIVVDLVEVNWKKLLNYYVTMVDYYLSFVVHLNLNQVLQHQMLNLIQVNYMVKIYVLCEDYVVVMLVIDLNNVQTELDVVLLKPIER